MSSALEILRDRLAEDSLELSYDNMDGTFVLRLVLDSIGESEEGVIVTEVSEVPVEDQEKYGYYHFMSVLADGITDDVLSDKLVSLNDENLETLLGSYLVIPGSGTLVHKYVLRTANEKAEETAEELYNCLVDIVAVVSNAYDRLTQ